MGPLLVEFVYPGLSNLAHLLDGFEHVGVYFVPVGLVEAFDERVLVGLTKLDEARLDAAAGTPLSEENCGELGPIVQTQRSGLAVQLDQLFHHSDHARTWDRVCDFDPKHSAIAFVSQIESPESSASVKRIGHEVQRPGLVESRSGCQGLADACRHTPLGSARQIEVHGAVHPM